MKSNTKVKKKKEKEYDSIKFDSNEEILVYKWLLDAVDAGLVEKFFYQPTTFELCAATPIIRTKYKFLKKHPFIKMEEREVNKVGRYVYTPDFLIWFSDEMKHYYPDCFLYTLGEPLHIDVKGDFNRGQNNSSGITFGIKSAWVYHTQGEFIQKVKPKELFARTWVPESCRFTPVRKQLVKEYTKPKYNSYNEALEYRHMIDDLLLKKEEG